MNVDRTEIVGSVASGDVNLDANNNTIAPNKKFSKCRYRTSKKKIFENFEQKEVLQIDQLSSVSVHLQLNLVEHAVGEDVSSALSNTTFILFICMQITMLAIHHLCLLVDLHTELQLCINDAFTIQSVQLMKADACDTILINQLSHK